MKYTKPTKIVFLQGFAGSGKDTAGQILIDNHEFLRVSFADAVKEIYAKQHNIPVEWLHKQGSEKEKHRPGLIEFAEGERDKDPLVWLKVAFEPYLDEDCNFKPNLNLVVTDCRRKDEIDWLFDQKLSIDLANSLSLDSQHYLSAYLFHVRRKGIADTDVLTHYCLGYAYGMNRATKSFKLIDAQIDNNESVEQLQRKVKGLVTTFDL